MGGAAQKYWTYSANYGSVATSIDVQLSRNANFRRPADEFIAETRTRLGHLNANAPQLPGNRCCGCLEDDEPEGIEQIETENEEEKLLQTKINIQNTHR